MNARTQNDDEVVRDGQTVSVRMNLMDAHSQVLAPVLHAPGSLTLSDNERERREKAIKDRYQLQSDAWRSPSNDQTHEQQTLPVADVAQALADRDERLTNAWKGGA